MMSSSGVASNASSMYAAGLHAIHTSKASASPPRAVMMVLLTVLCCCGSLVSAAAPTSAKTYLDKVWQIPQQHTSNDLNNYIATYLSMAIYNEDNFCNFVISTLGASSCVLLSAYNVKYAVLTSGSGKRVFVVIRGTDNPDNWIRSNVASQMGLTLANILGSSLIPVGSGFLTAFTSMAPNLAMAIGTNTSTRASKKNVFVMGHSLGGALASLATQYLAANGYRVKGAYTVGSPYVGQSAWSALYSGNGVPSFRLFHPGDCVTSVPIKALFSSDWIHVGIPVNVTGCMGVSAEMPCSSLPTSIFTIFANVTTCVTGCTNIHSGYLENFKKCLSKRSLTLIPVGQF